VDKKADQPVDATGKVPCPLCNAPMDANTTFRVRLPAINAAGPELLEACKTARDWHSVDGDHIRGPVRQQLIDAINAAEPKPTDET